jgi:hypothetical protein
LHLRGERCLGKKFCPRECALRCSPAIRNSCHQTIDAKGLPVEEDRGLQTVKDVRVGRLSGLVAQFHWIDTQLIHQSTRLFAVWKWGFYGQSSAVGDQQAALRAKFIALGVAAEVIMIVQNENAGGRAGARAVEVGSGQAADAAADDDEVKSLARINRFSSSLPEIAVAQGVRHLKRSPVTSSHAG